jgi:hypothetical protein
MAHKISDINNGAGGEKICIQDRNFIESEPGDFILEGKLSNDNVKKENRTIHNFFWLVSFLVLLF